MNGLSSVVSKCTSWSLIKAAEGYDVVLAVCSSSCSATWFLNIEMNISIYFTKMGYTTRLTWAVRCKNDTYLVNNTLWFKMLCFTWKLIWEWSFQTRWCKCWKYGGNIHYISYFFVKQTKSVSRMGTIYLRNLFERKDTVLQCETRTGVWRKTVGLCIRPPSQNPS